MVATDVVSVFTPMLPLVTDMNVNLAIDTDTDIDTDTTDITNTNTTNTNTQTLHTVRENRPENQAKMRRREDSAEASVQARCMLFFPILKSLAFRPPLQLSWPPKRAGAVQ